MHGFLSGWDLLHFLNGLTLTVHPHYRNEVCLWEVGCRDLNSAGEFADDFPLDLGQLAKKVCWHSARHTLLPRDLVRCVGGLGLQCSLPASIYVVGCSKERLPGLWRCPWQTFKTWNFSWYSFLRLILRKGRQTTSFTGMPSSFIELSW